MTLSSKARKVLAASLALSTVVWSVSLFAMPFAFAAAHSNGCLVNANGTLWLIDNGQRRGFPSAEVLLSNGYNFSQAVTASSDDTNLPVGPIMTFADGTLVKGPSDPLVYLVANGQKRGFVSASVFSGLGFQFGKIWTAAVNTFADLPTGANLESATERHTKGVLVIDGNGTVWQMSATGRVGIPSMDVFNSYGFSWDRTVAANAADVAAPAEGVLTARPGCSDTVNPGQPTTGFNPNGGTQGSINQITLGSRDESQALEGENNVEIYAADVETDNDGALLLKSADVWFSQVATASTKPWDYFEDVSLMANGTKVATLNADSSSDWSDYTDGNISETGSTREYRLRFSNLSVVLPNDDTTTLSVAVSMNDNLDDSDEDASWYVALGSVRVQDESNFTSDYTETVGTIEENFTVGGEETASLEVTDSDDEIDASVIEVSKTSDTNGVAIYHFDIEEQNDVDANIEEMTLTFATTGAENTVLRRASLYQGSTKVGEEAMSSDGVVHFDNMDIDIDGDDTETFTVKVDIYDTNDGARYAEGTTLAVSVTSIDTATDANDHDEDDINTSVSATSNTHELRSEGINVELNGTPTTTVTDDGDGATFVSGVEFKWNIKVTNFGDDTVYINKDVADIVSSSDSADVDMLYSVEKSGGADLSGLSGTVTSSATAITADSGAYSGAYNGETFYRISPNTSENFEITVSGVNSTDSKQVRALLNNVEWTTDHVNVDATYDASTATINGYTFNLGEDAATPFKLVN